MSYMSCAVDELIDGAAADIAPATSRELVSRWRSGAWSEVEDALAEEVPVALEFNGISHAVMMATPCDLEQFALGFALSEGIIGSASEFYGVDIEHSCNGITAHIEIASTAFARIKERRRSMSGRTGCGLCGIESLEHVLRPVPRMAQNQTQDRTQNQPLSARAIRRALAAIKARQPLNRSTGATHAALWCDSVGELQRSFEDVGRHNALDKLIGSLAQSHTELAGGFALITSRASVEMVQKAATGGIVALVAISAPTALAVRTAKECGMTLVAFARGDEFVAYANRNNIVLD